MTSPQELNTEGISAMLASKVLSFDIAVQYLRQGGMIIYPTETYFALGCALYADGHTLQRLYAAKARPLTRPLPLIGAEQKHIDAIAHITHAEKDLMDRFWPGPLTFLCRAKSCVPPLIRAGTGKVAVRISSHKIASALAAAVDEPLVCSSANRSGQAPVADPNLLDLKLFNYVDGILIDGNAPEGKLPSTIVEVIDNDFVRILREGAVDKDLLV